MTDMGRPGSPQSPAESEDKMIYTVFPKDSTELPQDFPTYQEAQEYAESLDCESVIESTTGECV